MIQRRNRDEQVDRDRRRRHRRPASCALFAKAWRRGDGSDRPRPGAIPLDPTDEHRRPSQRHDQTRERTGREPLGRPGGDISSPRSFLQFPERRAPVPRRVQETKPGGGLPHLPARADEGLRGSRWPHRIYQHPGGRHPGAGHALRSAGRLDGQGRAGAHVRAPARVVALQPAAAPALCRPLRRRRPRQPRRPGPPRRDAVSLAGAWRDDRDPDFCPSAA